VLIGVDMDEGALRASFDGCLLTDAEMKGGPASWAQLPDEFPSWEPPGDEGGPVHAQGLRADTVSATSA
jgi:hypothetical protein